ncbi:MAG: aldehyde dehydrogenase (NADP(+)) [Saprospiraceae bacterium]|nr:aldehyde dehydrogenase (NADP(+)) [Saprospiraceae bacterium]
MNPKTNQPLSGDFKEATGQEISAAIALAEQAFDAYRSTSPEQRATFLESIADEILNLGDALLERAMAETALPLGRLTGERGRTMNQLRLFASVVREGSWVDARIDPAQPDRQPMPRVDIRHMLLPLGPVAIFGASNFPLAFSVAGGDTASALAAGCPVVIKAHPAHPGTSEMVGRAIIMAGEKTGMPIGVCSVVQGTSHAVGEALVSHPLISAVGFTGSFRGGKALFDLANRRPVPIPVFAEMGSTNPVFVLPGALAERGEEIGKALAGSVTLGVGQFCTNPGLVFIKDDGVEAPFADALTKAIAVGTAGTMLTTGIRDAYEHGTHQLETTAEIEAVAIGQLEESSNSVSAKIFRTSLDAYLSDARLEEEVFGPSTILIRGKSSAQFLSAARKLSGHLTATVHGTPADLEANRELLRILERKVGRLLINGFPTGVEVCHAMVHGGPFPATTAPQSTSVGTNAIKRFARPFCYQNFTDDLLPDALKEGNPLGIWRMVDGQRVRD